MCGSILRRRNPKPERVAEKVIWKPEIECKFYKIIYINNLPKDRIKNPINVIIPRNTWNCKVVEI